MLKVFFSFNLIKNLIYSFYSISKSAQFLQARNINTNEAVAIKKMSYAGKQSIEVCVQLFIFYRTYFESRLYF